MSSEATLIPKSYAIGISYQSSNKLFVRNVAKALAEQYGQEKIFFDEFHPQEFTGGNSVHKLHKIFSEQCECVVPLFSNSYSKAVWCGIEWEAIKTRVDPDKIIPVTLDSTPIPDWYPGVITINRTKGKTGKQIANEIIRVYADKSQVISPNVTNMQKEDNRLHINSLEHGFVIVADISNFSNIPGSKLHEIIDSLWSIPENLGLLNQKSYANSLLDGIVLAINGCRHADLLDLCEKWIIQFKEATKNLNNDIGHELRIAVHQGSFYYLQSRAIIVGGAPNECSRLVRMAGPGQIVVSERFVDGWKEDEHRLDTLKELHPPSKEEPIGIQIKYGKQSYFRFYKLRIDEVVPLMTLQQAHMAEQVIMGVLKEIEEEFVELISTKQSGLTPAKINARLSIFVIDRNNPDKHQLIPTKFRYMRSKDKNKIYEKVGISVYSVKQISAPHGTVGKAFVEKKCQVLHKLPSYHRSNEDYIKILNSQPWNIPRETVINFSRKARCYIAVPFWLHNESKCADGVLCLDCMNPLDDISDKFLLECADEFGVFFGKLIAALFWIRA